MNQHLLLACAHPSNLETLSLKAFKRRLACCGVSTILDFTLAFGTPGIILMKSKTNSEGEWLIIARLEIPSATASVSSILSPFFF